MKVKHFAHILAGVTLGCCATMFLFSHYGPSQWKSIIGVSGVVGLAVGWGKELVWTKFKNNGAIEVTDANLTGIGAAIAPVILYWSFLAGRYFL